MKIHLPLLIPILALGVASVNAATTTIDFSGTQYSDNFTETANASNLNIVANALAMNNSASLAGIATYNPAFPSSTLEAFSLKIDGKFTAISSTFGGDSVGFFTNINVGSGYLAVFRIITSGGLSQADLRIFEGAKIDGTGVGTQVGSTVILGSGALATTFASDTYYTFKLDVSVTGGGSNIGFTGSILNTANSSTIGIFTTVTDSTATLGGTNVGLRIGTNGTNTNFTTVDNFTLSTAAIPEPSTYAAIGGLGALGIALYRRRNR